MPLTAQAADIAGRSVRAALPLHRLDPRIVNGVGLLEIVSLAVMLLTASGIALAVLAATAAVFVVLHMADERAVLALQDDGEATILRAGRHGRPVGVRTSIPDPPTLPEPRGLAASLSLGDTRWWIDRSAYPLLVQARSATALP